MTDHPITPPPALVQQWLNESVDEGDISGTHLANRAAQWGANQELEACCEVLHQHDRAYLLPSQLRAARRPKPPSAVAQAEALIERYEDGWCPSPAQWHVIREGLAEGRRALEQLDD